MKALKRVPKLRFVEFDEDWNKSILSKLTKITSGGTPNRSKENYWNGDIPWVTTSLINLRKINEAEEYITEEGLLNSSAKLFPKGTILMAMYGQGKTRGKVAVLEIEASTNQACSAIIVKASINNEFLLHYLNRQYTVIRRLSNEGGQKNLSGSLIKSIKIAYPQLPEQRKITAFLSSVDKKIDQLQQKKNLLEQYKKGVMQQLFSQQLRFKPAQSKVEGDDNGNAYPDWENKRLNELCDINKGEQLNAEFLTLDDKYPCINGGINASGYTNKFNREGNTITISEGGNSCGYVNFIETKFWCGGHCYSLDNIYSEVNNLFFYQILKYEQVKIMRLRVGSGLPNIQKKDILRFNIKLPSIQEQTKIANFLSAIDKKIELVSNQIENTQQFKKGLLQQMFV
jgi:type I restriction enzyme S subunit